MADAPFEALPQSTWPVRANDKRKSPKLVMAGNGTEISWSNWPRLTAPETSIRSFSVDRDGRSKYNPADGREVTARDSPSSRGDWQSPSDETHISALRSSDKTYRDAPEFGDYRSLEFVENVIVDWAHATTALFPAAFRIASTTLQTL